MPGRNYKALFSSDWSECLSPSGPFDPITFNYPELREELASIFRLYTSNQISLSEAAQKVKGLLPGPIGQEQMDSYLAAHFKTYKGLPQLIDWCHQNGVLFMINTTAAIGFFQRVFALGFLPRVQALSGHPLIRYPGLDSDPPHIFELMEIEDKPKNTQAVSRLFNIPPRKIIIMGDSGGDGPHFEWGARVGALLIGSMTKQSLQLYCQKRDIKIDHYFGLTYEAGQDRDVEKEMEFDFFELAAIIEERISG